MGNAGFASNRREVVKGGQEKPKAKES